MLSAVMNMNGCGTNPRGNSVQAAGHTLFVERGCCCWNRGRMSTRANPYHSPKWWTMRHSDWIFKRLFYNRLLSEIYSPYRKLNDAWNNLKHKAKPKFDIATALYARHYIGGSMNDLLRRWYLCPSAFSYIQSQKRGDKIWSQNMKEWTQFARYKTIKSG